MAERSDPKPTNQKASNSAGRVKPLRILSFMHKSRQVAYSLPGHFRELAKVRTPRQLYAWGYYKFPNLFPLRNYPTYLTVEVTNECNLSCKHCWRAPMSRPVGSMSVELFAKIVSELDCQRITEFKLGGSGEPSIHPQFREILALLRVRDLRVVLYTNGAVFQRFTAQEILNWELDTIVVSVDGLNAEMYERIKIGSSYKLLRKSLASFRCARELAEGSRTSIEIRHIIMPTETHSQLVGFRKDWLQIADSVMFNYLEPPKGLLPFADSHPPKCRQIRRELAIQWDGRVPLCGGYRQEYIGNVRESSIFELWRHPRLDFLRKCNVQRNFERAPLCMRCCHCR